MMHIKKRSAYSKLSQLRNLIINELDDFDKYLDFRKQRDTVNQKTIFSGKSTDQIADMIVLRTTSDDRWSDRSHQFVVILTEYLSYLRDQGEVVLTPSLYLQYMDLEKLIAETTTKTCTKSYEKVLAPLRDFVNSLTSCKTDLAFANEQFGFITLSLIKHLEYLETIKVSNSTSDHIAIQKTQNMRIAHANYSHQNLSKNHCFDISRNGLTLVYKHIVESVFFGVVSSIDAQHTTFEESRLQRCQFNYSSFEWTKFIDTSIKGTVFNQCKIFDVDFAGMTDTNEAVFINCRISLCKILNCKALFIDCRFDDCELSDNLRIINNKDNKAEKQDVEPIDEAGKTYVSDIRTIFVIGSSGMIIEALSGMLVDSEADEMVTGRAMTFIAAITVPLAYLRDQGYIKLNLTTYIEYMELSKVEELLFKHDGKYGAKFDEVLRPLLAYIKTVPDYDISRVDKGQSSQTNEQFGFIAMQVLKVLNHLESLKD